jgi:hypothetical protein
MIISGTTNPKKFPNKLLNVAINLTTLSGAMEPIKTPSAIANTIRANKPILIFFIMSSLNVQVFFLER